MDPLWHWQLPEPVAVQATKQSPDPDLSDYVLVADCPPPLVWCYENDDDDDDIDGFVDVVREWEHDPEDDPAGAHSNQVNINTGLWSWDVVHRDSFDAVDLYQPWTYLLEQTWQPSRDYRQASVCDSQRMLDHRHLPHDVYHTISFEQRTTPLPVRIGNHVGTGITFPDYVKGLKATFCL